MAASGPGAIHQAADCLFFPRVDLEATHLITLRLNLSCAQTA